MHIIYDGYKTDICHLNLEGLRLAHAIGYWTCILAARHYCCSWSGSAVLISIGSIIDRIKNISGCAEIADKLPKGTLKPQL